MSMRNQGCGLGAPDSTTWWSSELAEPPSASPQSPYNKHYETVTFFLSLTRLHHCDARLRLIGIEPGRQGQRRQCHKRQSRGITGIPAEGL